MTRMNLIRKTVALGAVALMATLAGRATRRARGSG